MAINFPASPSVNDTFTVGSITYKCVQNNPTKWIGLGVTPADRLVEGSNSLEINAGNDLVWTGDNVGVGISNPATKLVVASSDSTAADMRFQNSGTGYAANNGMWVGINNNEDGLVYNYHNSPLLFGTNDNERLRITNDGQVLVGTDIQNSFNGVGQAHNLIVAGSTSDTDITDNSKAAITISNTDGTANNTAGLHFAREDNDGNPHYCGASIVTQFKEAQVTGQYPKADLAFLTSTAANNAPSEKMRIYANGAVTKPENPLIRTLSSEVYGASQSLTSSPPSAISNAGLSISRGTNGFSTTGSNAYTFVCPVTGVYAVFAHISLGNVTEPDGTREAGDRTIWTMGYTLGGGNLPLANYVEIIDTNVFDFENASYYGVWDFTAGTRVGCGLNSGNGTASGLAMEWGIHLIQ